MNERINVRRKRNSSNVNLTISIIFHSVLVLSVFFLAAREGFLGKKLATLAVTMVPKEKKPEPPKEKAPEPKIETAKTIEAAHPTAAPAPRVETAAAPPPVDAAPSVAPAAVILPTMEFNDGAHAVQGVSDPHSVYKALVERGLRSRWNRPEGIEDETFVAEVRLSVDNTGQATGYEWVKGSGNTKWDDSVKAALAKTKGFSHAPPKGFPEKFLVRFDVQSEKTEEVMQLSSR